MKILLLTAVALSALNSHATAVELLSSQKCADKRLALRDFDEPTGQLNFAYREAAERAKSNDRWRYCCGSLSGLSSRLSWER